MRYVIIGNSAAAIGAVEGIRTMDQTGEILLISSEPHHTYSRPLISYLLQGKTTQVKMRYRGARFYQDNSCTLLSGKTAAGIDAAAKSVFLEGGQALSYDKLLIAAGSRAFVPPVEGLDAVENPHTFMSLDDAMGIEKELAPHKRVLIVGAGLIGLKCAEGIFGRVAEITVVDLAPRILSSILEGAAALMVQRHLEEKGIRFKLSSSVSRFEGGAAILENGEKLAFDILVLAVGVRPNTELVRGIAEVDRGIVVNERAQTSAKDIYAAGDCTQCVDVSTGKSKVMALLPNAYMQGECAGINMAGGNKAFDKAIPMNAIGFFGLHIITAGTYQGEVYESSCDKTFKRLFYSDNRLNGYMMIGEVEKAGIYTSLIRERSPLNTLDFALICEKPGLMAFAREDRAAKLGGIAT